MFMGIMPYHGDSPVEAWEYWFDEPPSQAVCSSLERLGKKHPAATIIEAIEITGNRAGRLLKVIAILHRVPCRCDSPVEAWEYWFDEPPS
jgi:hypothetical protein